MRVLETLPSHEILSALGARAFEGASAGVPRGASIDTRTLERGDIFFAFAGGQSNGHAFVPTAFEKGAAFAVVTQPLSASSTVPFVRVEDAGRALTGLATAVRRRMTTPVVAITGSMGKTTTKEFCAAMMGSRNSTLKTAGNLNNLLGVPLTLLRAEVSQSASVLECGMSEKGELSKISALVRPDVALITNVAAVHLEFFSSVDGIADAKAEIFEALSAEGTAVVPQGDERLLARARRSGRRVFTFGVSGGDLRADAVERTFEGSQFRLSHGGNAISVSLPVPGEPALLNFLAAGAAAMAAGASLTSVARAATTLESARGRGQREVLGDDVLLIDDSYNSNPEALVAAVVTMNLASGRRRVACVGDMLELGPQAQDLHRDAGHRIASQLDVLLGCGPLTKSLVDAASEVPPTHRRAFESSADLAREIDSWVRPKDVVLVKGSRGTKMERVVEALKKSHPVAAEAGR